MKTQAQCDQANFLREYEKAHKVYMNTSIFTEAGKKAKEQLEIARGWYLLAYQIANPTHLAM